MLARRRYYAGPTGLTAGPVPIVQPRGELAGLLTVAYPKTRLADMALDQALRRRIERVLIEQRSRQRIHEHGLSPLRKLLFTGALGTGKTMTAAALAGELGLPLFTIQLDGLITKYLGEAAAKLRLIFDTIRETRAVYLLMNSTRSVRSVPRRTKLAKFAVCSIFSCNSWSSTIQRA